MVAQPNQVMSLADYLNFERAADLYGAAQAVWTALGTTVEAFGPGSHRDSLASAAIVVKALGQKRIDDLIAKRAGLTKDAALDLALQSPTAPVRSTAEKSLLTKREREIAALISQGLSNKAVAESLVISPRTVDGHVERILAKLDFTSRTQIASWVASNAVS
jgi:DNA-binding NarL/FixJ family response regulator